MPVNPDIPDELLIPHPPGLPPPGDHPPANPHNDIPMDPDTDMHQPPLVPDEDPQDENNDAPDDPMTPDGPPHDPHPDTHTHTLTEQRHIRCHNANMIPPIVTGSNSFFQRKGSNNGFQRVTTGKLIEMQVRAGDQAAYPHHMPALLAEVLTWVPLPPASDLPATKLRSRYSHYDTSFTSFETAHTHTHPAHENKGWVCMCNTT